MTESPGNMFRKNQTKLLQIVASQKLSFCPVSAKIHLPIPGNPSATGSKRFKPDTVTSKSVPQPNSVF
jgi:hypothetical protein